MLAWASIMSKWNCWILIKKTEWDLLAVYGAAHFEHKNEFLTELAVVLHSQKKPMVLGGDFNIIRKESKKTNQGVITNGVLFLMA